MSLHHNLTSLGVALICSSSIYLQASAEEATPVRLAEGVVQRMAPSAASIINFKIDPKATEISIAPVQGKVLITANDTRGLIVGFGYYARHIAKVHWSWNGDRMTPKTWPLPKETVSVKLPWKHNFAFNYCTLSYTSAFWDWNRWQREIDMLAMNGYDVVLIQAGLEKVWQDTLRDLGYPEDKIIKFLPSPAFAAWWNMGNLEGHGGPLTQNLIDNEAKLGKQIATRLRQFNMTPLLQGFVGLVPHDLGETVKDAKIIPQGQWCAGFVRPAIIDPTSDDFLKISKLWYKNLHKIYGGKTAFYGGDLFHEGGNSHGIDITKAASNVEKAMQEASPNSSWVLQCWGGNPSGKLLQGLSKDKCFVLYLDKGLNDPAVNMRTFEDVPWAWSELSNFGGNNSGMYGGLVGVSQLKSKLDRAKAKNLQGLALLSEGTEQNPIYYELFQEMLTKNEDVNLDQWIDQYIEKRYGTSSKEASLAWKDLAKSVYNPPTKIEGCYEGIVCARPGWNVTRASSWGPSQHNYDFTDVINAANHMLAAVKKDPSLAKQSTFRYDLMDVTKQVLSDFCLGQLQEIKLAYDMKDIKEYNKKVAQFLQAIEDIDALTATNPSTLLGIWCERAKAKGKTPEEKKLMDRSAKMQVTTWSAGLDGLNDYSNRHWSGLVKDYYYPRWDMFFKAGRNVLEGKMTQEEANKLFREEIKNHDTSFYDNDNVYPTKTKGNIVELAEKCLKRYSGPALKLAKKVANNKGIQWDLQTMTTPLTFKVSDTVMSAGTFVVSIDYKAGNSALKIQKVELFEGDKLVAKDEHEGWTGHKNENNTYILKLPKFRDNLDDYFLKVFCEGASGKDSKGVMIIRQKN